MFDTLPIRQLIQCIIYAVVCYLLYVLAGMIISGVLLQLVGVLLILCFISAVARTFGLF